MEILAILAAMKELGFEPGHILGLITIYFLLRRDLAKPLEKHTNKIEEHEERIDIIEAHVGLKKPKPIVP